MIQQKSVENKKKTYLLCVVDSIERSNWIVSRSSFKFAACQ